MELVKLKFEAFKTADCDNGSKLNRYIYTFMNPENYAMNQEISWSEGQFPGDPAETKEYNFTKSYTVSFSKLIVDGTGVMAFTKNTKDYTVDQYIDWFRKVVYEYDGTLHQPPFVKITWGNLLFKGVCSSFNVNYTMFNPDGTALRAVVDLQFYSTETFLTKTQKAGKSSPDMTHLRTVQAGDTLPLMTYRIYGDSSYYLEVAKANGLSSINSIRPGDKLYFPPLKKH